MAIKRTINRLYKDIDMSFKVNALSGDIGKKLDVNAVKQSVKSLLLTKPHEKFFNPEKITVLAGIFTPIAKVSVANNTFKSQFFDLVNILWTNLKYLLF